MTRFSAQFLFLNVGHLLDHLVMLIFASVAALFLADAWGLDYDDLIPYGTAGLVAFGAFALLAGWLGDKWSREAMMSVFFLGIGASAIATGFADTPLQIGAGLLVIGVFAAIYHPVGLAMVVEGRGRTGIPIAINGIYGNMGVALAALVTGVLIDLASWRAAFFVPGAVAIAVGLAWMLFLRGGPVMAPASVAEAAPAATAETRPTRAVLIHVFAVIFFTTALGGLVFQSTTFALPKVFDERLAGFAISATAVGGYAFVAFTAAAFAQLIVGWLVDNYSVRWVFAGVAACQAVLFVAMVYAEGLLAFFIAVGFMLAVFGQIPINDVLVGRMAKSEWRARAFAARYIVTFAVAATALNLIAWLHETWGFEALFMVLAGAAAAILCGTLMLPKRI
ncbi:MAG: MFS transporter [Alphaproteobacteria bacterium]|nr:MFS transporter [Alphaproteobacteria bacterium]